MMILVILVITGILLFSSMVLSSMAAADVSKQEYEDAHKWATTSSLVSGISVALVILVTVLYIHSEKIANYASSALGRAANAIRPK